MSQGESLTEKCEKELQLQKEKYKNALLQQMAEYKTIENNLSELQVTNTEKMNSIIKRINELVDSKNMILKISNHEDPNVSSYLSLSAQNHESFLNFMSSATNNLHNASTLISSIEDSLNNSYSNLRQDVNLVSQNIKNIFNGVKRSYELAHNLVVNKDIINEREKEFSHSMGEEHDSEDISFYE